MKSSVFFKAILRWCTTKHLLRINKSQCLTKLASSIQSTFKQVMYYTKRKTCFNTVQIKSAIDILQPNIQVFKFASNTHFTSLLPEQIILESLTNSVQTYPEETISKYSQNS